MENSNELEYNMKRKKIFFILWIYQPITFILGVILFFIGYGNTDEPTKSLEMTFGSYGIFVAPILFLIFGIFTLYYTKKVNSILKNTNISIPLSVEVGNKPFWINCTIIGVIGGGYYIINGVLSGTMDSPILSAMFIFIPVILMLLSPFVLFYFVFNHFGKDTNEIEPEDK